MSIILKEDYYFNISKYLLLNIYKRLLLRLIFDSIITGEYIYV